MPSCKSGAQVLESPRENKRRSLNGSTGVEKSWFREGGGTGLGLSISEWIAQVHHGTIDVESELAVGSTFIVRLPVSKPQSPFV
jgi:signal transduction histidine kinase